MPEFRQPTGQMYTRRSPRRPLGGVDERLYVALPLLHSPDTWTMTNRIPVSVVGAADELRKTVTG